MTAPAGDRFVTGLTDDQLKAVETMAEDLMIEILTQVADHYADLLVERATKAGALVAAADDAVPPGAGEGAFVDPQDLAGISGATSAAIAAEMVPLVAEVYLSGAARIRAEMIDATGLTLPPIRSVDALNYLANSANTFDEIGDDLWGAVRSELAAGFDAGEGIPQLADRVRAAAGVTSRTATLTARTSVIDAANMGSISTAKASGLEMEKEWMATPDRRTRPTHRTADGQRVDLHGKFIVGGFEADYPADPSLPSQERRLCRCTIGYVIPDESISKVRPEARPEVLSPTTLPRQRQAPVAAATRGPDPALKMTVEQLKDAAMNHDVLNGTQFARLLSGKTKPQIVDTLRDLERAHSTKIADLPPAPRIVVPAPVTPQLGRPAGAPLTGNPPGDWYKMLLTPTGPAGVPVRDLRVNWDALGQYRVAHGTAWKDPDGVAYLIEHGEFEAGAQWVTKALAEMRAAHAQIPAASLANKSYAWLLERNPGDASWAVTYKMPNFRSYATAGDGVVNLWSRGMYKSLHVDSLRHETGHNLDDLIGKATKGSQGKAWADAVAADAATQRVFRVFPRSGERITPTTDAKRNYPDGVTEYGKSSDREDFAESVMLYQLNEFADANLGADTGPRAGIFFRDIYPNRAAIIDGLFPDIARAQKAAIKLRDAKLVVPKVAETPGAAAKRAAARARQAAIDKAQMRAGALNEIDEVVGVSADPLILQNRLNYFTDRKIITKAEAGTIAKAAATGDRSKLTAALGRLAAKSKVAITAERAGDIVDFDPMRMQTVGTTGAQLSAGVKVRVMRGGAEFDYDGDRVELEKILVRPTTRDELRRVREAKADSARELAGLASILERDKLGMSGAEIRTQLARSNMPAASRIALEKVADDPIKLKRAIAAELRKTKIRPEGKPAATGVDYDPETMATLGGVEVPTGVKVRIVERGYSVDVDGERVVLVRAFVEPIIPKPKKIAKQATAKVTVSPQDFDARVAKARKGTAATAATKYRFTGNSKENSDLFPDPKERQSIADAFASYRGIGSSRINKRLRAGETDSRVERMDRAFAVSPLSRDVLVWRGTRGEPIFGKNWIDRDLTGAEFDDPAFVSTSAARDKAEPFARGGGVLMRIVAPEGTPAVGIRPAMRIEARESEILLGRGLKYRVVRDNGPEGDFAHVLDVEIVPTNVARKTPGGALTGTDALDSAPWALGARTGEVADAVRKYRASAYVSINSALRSGKLTPATRALVGRIDEAMDQSTLPNDVILWRGDDGAYLPAGNADGFEWTDEGFLSTTVTQANAEKYGGTILRIVTPSGTKALKLSELGGRKEGEMLLQRGLRLRVVRDAGRVDGVRRVDVEIVPAPTSVRAGRAAPAYTPPASVSAADQKRAAALVKRDPQIMATVQERFGGISTSGNLSQADAAWLDALAKREPAFVERLAQTTRIEEDLRRAAKAAGMTPAKLRDAIAARLREIFDGKPVGVRVGSETVLRSILSGGRFKTQFDGAKRNGHLVASQEKRRLFEQTLGVDPGADLEVRPVYGYVMPNGVERVSMADGQTDLLSAYGEIQVVLKSSVRPRTTATIGDSLDRMFMVQPSPIDDPSALSAGLSYSWKIDKLEEVFTQEFRRGNYIEAQIHGGVVVDDIAEVVFPSQPDSTTVKALADVDIPWRVLNDKSDIQQSTQIHDLIDADDATIEAALRDVFEGKFGPYTTKVTVGIRRAGTRTDSRGRVRKIEPSIWVDGKIYNASGTEIGDFGRSIGPVDLTYPNGVVRREVWAEHSIVQIESKYQGKGFGTEFNKRAIDWYRASGVHGITLNDHNGYVWASQGFGFSGGVVPDHVAESLREMVADLRAGRSKNKYGEAIPERLRSAPDLDKQIAEAEALLARLGSTKPGEQGYPTAYEMSQLGRRGRHGKTALWIGRHLSVPAEEMVLNPNEGVVISS